MLALGYANRGGCSLIDAALGQRNLYNALRSAELRHTTRPDRRRSRLQRAGRERRLLHGAAVMVLSFLSGTAELYQQRPAQHTDGLPADNPVPLGMLIQHEACLERRPLPGF